MEKEKKKKERESFGHGPLERMRSGEQMVMDGGMRKMKMI